MADLFAAFLVGIAMMAFVVLLDAYAEFLERGTRDILVIAQQVIIIVLFALAL